MPKIGLNLQELTSELAKRLGYDGGTGVLVSDVERGSLADRAGIKRGSLILEINRQPVSTVENARKLLKAKKGESLLLLIQQGESLRYLALKFDE